MRRLPFDRQAQLLALGAALPALIVAEILLWTDLHTASTRWTLTILFVLCGYACAHALRERIVPPLRTLANVISAIRQNDFSIRARGERHGDALGEVLLEVNALTETLREQRLGALEATALLGKVMEEIDVAVFAFDPDERLRLTNRAGERLLALTAARLLDRSAQELALSEHLHGELPRVVDAAFPGKVGRWEIRTSVFREGGVPHRLLVIADVSGPLREEEWHAWQRLIRVLSHELNNSLAPIQSIAASLSRILMMDSLAADWREDTRRGLSVIASRAEALSRFTAGYARLARLPAPRPEIMEIGDLIRRVAGLETRLTVVVAEGPPACLPADPDQIEQLLINLVRNAADAALETGGGVVLGWRRSTDPAAQLEVWVEDEGPGLSSTTNLFVPFFTTKSGGSGIGLVLSRQIAEAHGGTLALENRDDGRGAVARLRFPLHKERPASDSSIQWSR